MPVNLPAWTELQTWFTENVNGLDAVFATVIAVYAVRGILRGLSAEMAGAIGFLLVLIGGWKLYRPLADWMLANTRLSSLESANLLALILSIVVLAAVLGLIKMALKSVLEKAFEGTAERLGGLAAGFTKGFVVCTVFVFAVKLSGHAYLGEHVIHRSLFGTFVAERVPGWYALLRDKYAPPAAEGDDQEICEPGDPAKPGATPAGKPANPPAAKPPAGGKPPPKKPAAPAPRRQE